ncbi:MAG: NAD(P)/FAD-dependent oxidoreductase, partial [Ignavibacteriaceae bacterium]
MIGDAAGVIAPLAGDGIGIALQSAKLLSHILLKKREEKLSMSQTEQLYERGWQNLFAKRIRMASVIQKIILQKNLRTLGIS